jgi:hypothetical protein
MPIWVCVKSCILGRLGSRRVICHDRSHDGGCRRSTEDERARCPAQCEREFRPAGGARRRTDRAQHHRAANRAVRGRGHQGGNVKHNSHSHFEPLTLLSALAASTVHIGLIATASTSYNLAKRPAHAARYDRAKEFVEVVKKLWDSPTTPRPENVVRVPWEPNQLVLFDNRITQHYAIDNYDGLPRRLNRVTVAGDIPVGVDGRPSESLEGDASHYTSVA